MNTLTFLKDKVRIYKLTHIDMQVFARAKQTKITISVTTVDIERTIHVRSYILFIMTVIGHVCLGAMTSFSN